MLAIGTLIGVAQWQRSLIEPVVERVDGGRQLPIPAEIQEFRGSATRSGNPLAMLEAVGEGPLAASVGKIRLDLAYGNFTIRPGRPGEGVRVSGTYEPDAFRLEEQYEAQEDGSWEYRVTFGAEGGTWGMLFSGAGNDPQNELTITLPPDLPFDLVGVWGVGALEAELGGLWLRTVELEVKTGTQELSFTTPTQWPLQRLEIEKGIGELEIAQLGNASPQVTRIEQSIGSLQVDLGGSWQIDGEVQIQSRVGELAVDAPDQAQLQLAGTDVWVGENTLDQEAQETAPAIGVPTVSLSAKLSVGELRVDAPRQQEAPETPPAPEVETEDAESEVTGVR